MKGERKLTYAANLKLGLTTLLCCFFLICNSFLTSLTGTSVVLCALSTNRKTDTVANTAVTTDIHQTLDVHTVPMLHGICFSRSSAITFCGATIYPSRSPAEA